MSQLKIVDLSFCDREFPQNREVIGGRGITIISPTGAWSASADWSHNSGYATGHYFDRSTGAFSYFVAAGVTGSMAGAVAGALSDGSYYASTYTSAGS